MKRKKEEYDLSKFDYICDGQEDLCDVCAFHDGPMCMICDNQEFFKTKEQKDWDDMMCDLMCGE